MPLLRLLDRRHPYSSEKASGNHSLFEYIVTLPRGFHHRQENNLVSVIVLLNGTCVITFLPYEMTVNLVTKSRSNPWIHNNEIFVNRLLCDPRFQVILSPLRNKFP